MLDGILKPKLLLFCLVLLAATIIVACGEGTLATPSTTPIPAEASPPTPTTSTTSTYWPTQNWRSSTPEQQGMDSDLLVEMLDQIQERKIKIHSVLVVRNGYMVLEAYFDPYEKDISHVIHSATKSITSALMGIAIHEGYIDGVDHLVLDYFPQRTGSNLDPAKQTMTIEHLLAMTSGLNWPEVNSPYISPLNPVRQMLQSRDMVKFVLDRPMKEEPGTRFNYNSGASHLLSAIIQKATAVNALSFARKHLFESLGISDMYWPLDPDGIASGGFGLRMTPPDMAKFGYLYLNKGAWDGIQIVPAEWTERSTKRQTPSAGYGPYGYHWWTGPRSYWASGFLGQRIAVIPSLEMVVVFTGEQRVDVNTSLLEQFILKAAESSEALPKNPEGTALLKSRVKELAQPEPKPVPLFPETAQRVSGTTYVLDPNHDLGSFAPSLDWRSLSFEFQESATEALFSLSYGDDQRQWELPVGLDDVYRTTDVEAFGPVALKGFWQDDKTFVLQNQLLGPALWAGLQSDIRLDFGFTFEEDGVAIQLTSSIMSLRTHGEPQD